MVTCFKAVAVRMRSGGLGVCLETASTGLAGGLDSGGEGGKERRSFGPEQPWLAWDRGQMGRGTEGVGQRGRGKIQSPGVLHARYLKGRPS